MFFTPVFTPDASPLTPNLWTLQALETKLTKAGDHFFDLLTGDAYNPADPTLTDAQPNHKIEVVLPRKGE